MSTKSDRAVDLSRDIRIICPKTILDVYAEDPNSVNFEGSTCYQFRWKEPTATLII